MTLTARYNGTCAGACGRPIHQGEAIEWDEKARRTWHRECFKGRPGDVRGTSTGHPSDTTRTSGQNPDDVPAASNGRPTDVRRTVPDLTGPNLTGPQMTTSSASASADADSAAATADRLLEEYDRTVLAARGPVQDATYTVEFGAGDYVTLSLETIADPSGQKVQRAYARADSKHSLSVYGERTFSCFAIVRGRRSFGVKRLKAAEEREIAAPFRRLMMGLDAILRSNDELRYGEAFARLSGLCCRCKKDLTVPVSLNRGLGPKCAQKWRAAA